MTSFPHGACPNSPTYSAFAHPAPHLRNYCSQLEPAHMAQQPYLFFSLSLSVELETSRHWLFSDWHLKNLKPQPFPRRGGANSTMLTLSHDTAIRRMLYS